jgi:hypothetical protein
MWLGTGRSALQKRVDPMNRRHGVSTTMRSILQVSAASQINGMAMIVEHCRTPRECPTKNPSRNDRADVIARAKERAAARLKVLLRNVPTADSVGAAG